MKITKEKNGDTLTVAIEGELDIKTSPELKEALEGELDDVMTLLFDLKDLAYTSSVGLRVMLGAFHIMEEKDGRMVLMHLNDDLKEIMELSGFADFLEIED